MIFTCKKCKRQVDPEELDLSIEVVNGKLDIQVFCPNKDSNELNECGELIAFTFVEMDDLCINESESEV